jgi:hypothetical protein
MKLTLSWLSATTRLRTCFAWFAFEAGWSPLLGSGSGDFCLTGGSVIELEVSMTMMMFGFTFSSSTSRGSWP